MTELILGTAQFGSAYGATNSIGRLDDDAVAELLTQARRSDILTFDTAADYGDSQQRLGSLAPAGNRYVTKFSLGEGTPNPHSLYRASRATLGVRSLAGVMFHRMSDLADPRSAETISLLRAGREEGELERIGVSIYDTEDLEVALSVFPDLDLVQFPANILDRRLLEDARINELAARGVELHVRSAFLQGILLADPDTLSSFFAPLLPVLRELRAFSREHNVSLPAVLLGFLRDHPLIDGVVVGATTPAELSQIVVEWSVESTAFTGIRDLPPHVLDPRQWPR